MLTKPKNIDYELYVFKYYLGLMEFMRNILERNTTIEEDFVLLK